MRGWRRARGAVVAFLLAAHCGGVPGTGAERAGGQHDRVTLESWVSPRKDGLLSGAERDTALQAFGPQRLRVLDHGAAPHAVMAYAIPPSDEQVSEASIAMRVTTPAGELVETRQKVLLHLRTGATEGSATRFSSQLLWVSGEVPAGLGSVAEFTFMPDGRVEPTPSTSPLESCREASVEVATTTVDSIVQLPSDPIGVGARWQVARQKGTAVANVLVVTTYELTAITGRDLDVNFQIDGYFIEDESENAPPSEFVTKVSGTGRASLGHPMATQMEQKGSSKIVVVGPEGAPQSVQMDVTGGLRTLAALPTDVSVPAVAACSVGDSERKQECDKLIGAVNAGQLGLKDFGDDPTQFEVNAKKLDGIAAALSMVQLSEPMLASYRDAYRAVIVDMAQVVRDMAKQDPTIVERADAAAQRENDVIGKLNAFCGRQ